MKGLTKCSFFSGFLIMTCLIFLSFNVYSQQSSIMYYMSGVPQSHLLNPATQPRCGFYLGFPGVSPLQINAENSAFGFSDVFSVEGDSLILPLHPDADFKDFYNNFSKTNYVSADVSSSIISFGFRSGKIYQSYAITQRFFSRFSYPRDLIDFAYYGPVKGKEFDFSGFGADLISYLEISSGVSQKINDMITIGYRGKLLFGQANISTKKTDITFQSEDTWNTHTEFEINAALPGVDIPTDANGEFKYDDMEFDDDIQPFEIVSAVTGNFGLGLDLGAHIKPVDKLTISASILDLGYIRWKSSTYNITQNADFIFDGVEFAFSDTSDFGQPLLDSLENVFTLNNSEIAYTTFLPAKVYLGLKYDIIEQISVGFLSRTEIYKGNLRQQFNLSVNFYPLKMIAASFNYSIMNRTYNNFGMGLALKAGPFNMYLISDNVPLTYVREVSSNSLIPNTLRTVNFRMGFNLMFGCRNRKQAKAFKDVPLIY